MLKFQLFLDFLSKLSYFRYVFFSIKTFVYTVRCNSFIICQIDGIENALAHNQSQSINNVICGISLHIASILFHLFKFLWFHVTLSRIQVNISTFCSPVIHCIRFIFIYHVKTLDSKNQFAPALCYLLHNKKRRCFGLMVIF